MRSVSLSLLNVWTIVVFAVVSSIYAVTAKLNPVVIVPGLGGSAMEAKLSGQSKRFRDCRTNSSWYSMIIGIALISHIESIRCRIIETGH